MQALIIDNLISKIWGGVYSEHLKYYLPQDEVDESEPITFRKYVSNVTAKTGKYAGDPLFHAIPRDKNSTTVNFMYFPHHRLEATKVLNVLTCILSEELLINPNNFITKSGIERGTIGIWDKEKRTFTKPNELHNE